MKVKRMGSDGRNDATNETIDFMEYDDEGHFIIHGEPVEYISTLNAMGSVELCFL